MQNDRSVHQLNNDYVTRLRASETAHNAQKTQMGQRRRKRALGILLVFAVALVLCLWAYGQNMASLRKINQETTTTNRQLSSSKQKNGQLNQQVKQLHNSDYLTQLIRGKYLYSKNGEVVYNLPKDAK